MPDDVAEAADNHMGEKVEEAAALTRPDLQKDSVSQGWPATELLVDILPV